MQKHSVGSTLENEAAPVIRGVLASWFISDRPASGLAALVVEVDFGTLVFELSSAYCASHRRGSQADQED